MAKITQQDRQRKQHELNQLVEMIFWEQGASAITYSEVAKRYGTSKSGIQRYYSSQNEFIDYLKSALVSVIEQRLDWSGQTELMASWFEALSDEEDTRFRQTVEFLMREALVDKPGQPLSTEFERFRLRLKSSFNSDMEFFYLLGKTYANLTGGYQRYDMQLVK